MYYSPLTVTFTPRLFIPMQLLSKLGFFFSSLVLFFFHFSFHFKGIYASHLTQVVHELPSIWLGERTSYLLFSSFCISLQSFAFLVLK